MKQDSRALTGLIEEVATLLEATVRAEEGVFHLTVPVSGEGGEGEDDEGEEEEMEDDEPSVQVSVALSVSEDGTTLFATRRLCAHDESIDLESLLRELSSTIHVQLSIDEDEDLVVGGAAPVGVGAAWIADMVGELAEFALDIAEDAAPVEEDPS